MGRSVVDGLDAQAFQFGEVVRHRLEDLGGVALPVGVLADHPERVP